MAWMYTAIPHKEGDICLRNFYEVQYLLSIIDRVRRAWPKKEFGHHESSYGHIKSQAMDTITPKSDDTNVDDGLQKQGEHWPLF